MRLWRLWRWLRASPYRRCLLFGSGSGIAVWWSKTWDRWIWRFGGWWYSGPEACSHHRLCRNRREVNVAVFVWEVCRMRERSFECIIWDSRGDLLGMGFPFVFTYIEAYRLEKGFEQLRCFPRPTIVWVSSLILKCLLQISSPVRNNQIFP